MATKKVYTKEFYKKLSAKEKELIYQGAMQLASGCLAFETPISGAPMMSSRLGIIQGMLPWFVRIATDAAEDVGIIDLTRMSQEALVEENSTMSTTEKEEKDPEEQPEV